MSRSFTILNLTTMKFYHWFIYLERILRLLIDRWMSLENSQIHVSYCHSVTVWNECLYLHSPKPHAPSHFNVLEIQIEPSMSQPIRSESDDLMSGWVLSLVLGITTPPPPVLMLLLANLLGYSGPTIVKPVLCLETGQWAWALDGSRQELHCLVEVPPLLPSLYKSPEPPVISGEADWTAGSMHLHHALGTSQVWAHALICALAGRHGLQLHYWGCRSLFKPFGVQVYPGCG